MDNETEDHNGALATLEAALRRPLEIGFPPLLPMELALRIDTPANICAIYNIDKDEFAAMIQHPVFIKAYQEAVEALKVDGMSFKVKAKMMAEEYLKTAFSMVQDKNTSDNVRADLIKATVRWGGLDAKTDMAASPTFNIQLNLA
ncbi:MAG: hypothetical protein ACKO0Z_00530 [Betaproteobacteria bacterium]